jgi:hypothetical protein
MTEFKMHWTRKQIQELKQWNTKISLVIKPIGDETETEG